MRKFWKKAALAVALLGADVGYGQTVFGLYESKIDQDSVPVITMMSDDGEVYLSVVYQAPSIGVVIKKANGLPFGLNFDGHLLEVRGSGQKDKFKIGGGDYEGDSIGWVTPAYRTFDSEDVWMLSGDEVHVRVAGEGSWSFSISDPGSIKEVEGFKNACGDLFRVMREVDSRETANNTPGGYAVHDANDWLDGLARRPSRSVINAKARAGARARGYESSDSAWYFEQFTNTANARINGN